MRMFNLLALAPAALLPVALGGCSLQALQPEQRMGIGAAAPSLVCEVSSNCVNSLGSGEFVPLRHEGTPEQGMALLRRTLALFPEAQVTHSSPMWLVVIFTTPLGFRDEVVFVVDGPHAQIAYRSRSLVGLYDFGKNASRMQTFIASFRSLK